MPTLEFCEDIQKTKFELFEDLTGFIKPFVNQAASHLRALVQNGGFL